MLASHHAGLGGAGSPCRARDARLRRGCAADGVGRRAGGRGTARYGEIGRDMGRYGSTSGRARSEITRDYPRLPEITRDYPRVGRRAGGRGPRRQKQETTQRESERRRTHTTQSQTNGWDTELVVAAVWEDAGLVVTARMAFSPVVNGVPCVRAGERLHGGGEDDLHLSAGQATS